MPTVQKYARSIRNTGLLAFARYWWHQKTKLPRSGVFDLTARTADHPLRCRARTSDIDVFKHIFVLQEYERLKTIENPGLVIDCGANVGMSTAYFLSQFPGARVVAVEPDPDNYAQLQHNTRHFGDRVRAVQAGVWSHRAGLKFVEEGYGDGRAWAVTVTEVGPGEAADLQAVGIADLLDEADASRIALLKIDIEGSERNLFAKNTEAWLGRVDNMVIELHGDACERVFYDAIKPYNFDVMASGGVVMCRSKQ